MKRVLCIIILFQSFACFSQESDLEKRTRFFTNYIKEIFLDFNIADGEYLFVLSSGCLNCTQAAISQLKENQKFIQKNYKAVFISQNSVIKMKADILWNFTNLFIDKTNKLDKMAFGISGISVLQIKNKKIVGFKSMTVSDYEKGLLFFLNSSTFIKT